MKCNKGQRYSVRIDLIAFFKEFPFDFEIESLSTITFI